MDDVREVIAAACAHDRAGDERKAVGYYDRAYAMGVPEDERRGFLVGYGSTLRNVGRVDDAIGVLGRAVADDPGYAPFQAFLALALGSGGHHKEALAAMLGCALAVAKDGAFDRFTRALGEYQQELLAPPAA